MSKSKKVALAVVYKMIVLAHFAHWDIFGLEDIRTFYPLGYFLRVLAHFELDQVFLC